MNPTIEHDRSRLATAVQRSREAHAPFRAGRLDVARQYASQRFFPTAGEAGDPDDALNMVALYIDTFSRLLAAQAPRALYVTGNESFKRTAKRGQLRVNARAKELRLEEFFQAVLRNALIGNGIGKVGIASGCRVEIGVGTFDVGMPFAAVVDDDDWVQDAFCNQWEEQQFRGNLYYPRIDALEDEGKFTGEQIAMLRSRGSSRTQGNEDGDPRAETITGGTLDLSEEFAPRACLWDIYLPYEKLICTFAASPDDGMLLPNEEPLDVREWDGPDDGPYLRLIFREVMGNAMPLPPIAGLLDLHDIMNSAIRKIGNGIRDWKRIGIVDAKKKDTAERVHRASNGDIVMGDGSAVEEHTFGGADSLMMAAAIWFKDLGMRYPGGGLDTLAGSDTRAETLGQEQMLFGSATRQVDEMRDRTVAFASRVMKSIGWWDWTDPVQDFAVPYTAPDGEVSDITITVAERRQLDLNALNIEVMPYSMQFSTPDMRLRKLLGTFERVLLPGMPYFQAQGMLPDGKQILNDIADLGDMPKIRKWLTNGPVPEGGAERPTQSPNTTRRTIREGRPSAENGNSEQAMMQRLISGAEGAPATAGA